MTSPRRIPRRSHVNLMRVFDEMEPGEIPPDTIVTGFPSVDRLLGGGMRKRDLVVLGGDVGSGKSALSLAIALRAAHAGNRVSYLSGEMHEDRVVERALAMEGRTRIEDLRSGKLSEEGRAVVGATALRLDDLTFNVFSMTGRTYEDTLADALSTDPELLVLDYLQLLPSPENKSTQEEDTAVALRSLKALALEREMTCLTVSQLPDLVPTREDPRPRLEDFGRLGSVKQHADLAMLIYREEMYHPSPAVTGATELIVGKNRGGPTGFVDLYFYQRWMRFEDVLDPDR